MNCPRCGALLSRARGGLYECSECLFAGSPKDITELINIMRNLDARIETIDVEKEYLLDARRNVILWGNMLYAQRVLAENGSKYLQSHSNSCPNVVKKTSNRSRIGLILASLELGAFMGWLVNNFYTLMDGRIPLTQIVLPIIFLFQGMILFMVSYK